jgi:hypothetical protein
LRTRDCENLCDSPIVGSQSSAKRPIRTTHGNGRSMDCRSQIGLPQRSQKNHRRSHRARRKGWEPFPKTATYCHLLAFWSRKTATTVSTVPFHSLPFEGARASLGPGLRTVSGAVRSVGAKLSPKAICPMTGESANSQKMLLAAAIAEGTAVANWASSNEVPKRTALALLTRILIRGGLGPSHTTRPSGSANLLS